MYLIDIIAAYYFCNYYVDNEAILGNDKWLTSDAINFGLGVKVPINCRIEEIMCILHANLKM